MNKNSFVKPIVVTMGDPSGVSAEIVFKTWLNRNKEFLMPFFIIDSEQRLKKISDFLNLNIPIKKITDPAESLKVFSKYLPVYNLKNKIEFELGKPLSKNAKLIIKSIKKAVKLVIKNQASAIVTNPIDKKILFQHGFSFAGQTEFISNIVSKSYNKKFEEIMILSTSKPDDSGTNLKVGLITTHLSLKEVSENISKKKIISKVISFVETLKVLWRIKNPKIGICALNPHSGENGKIGNEEEKHILPAIFELKKKNYIISGPLSADSCFAKSKRKEFDGIICMYHDQALIPIKTIDFFNSINITGGLPIIRTSPDHGPAFNIAKKNIANHNSFLSSVKAIQKMINIKNEQL